MNKNPEELWEEFGDYTWRIIKEKRGAIVVITAEDMPDGGLKCRSYTFIGDQFKSLKAFANLFPEMAQEAEEQLRKEFIPDGPVN